MENDTLAAGYVEGGRQNNPFCNLLLSIARFPEGDPAIQ